MPKKSTEELITDLAASVARGFEHVDEQFRGLRHDMDQHFNQVEERLDRIEFSVNGHDRRLDVLEDKVRRISVKTGLKMEG